MSPTDAPVRSVLFACNMNSVRSPMAAALTAAKFGDRMHVESVGCYEGAIDPFAQVVMQEAGVDVSGHVARTFEAVDPAGFDLIVALTPEARREAERFADAARIEEWTIANPSETRGNRDMVLDAYRETRAALERRISERFGG